MPSISGASRWPRATPGASTRTSSTEPIERVAAAGGDAVLQLAQLGQALVDEAGSDRAVEPGGVGALLGAVGEEPAPVEVGAFHEAQEGVVVALGLARVADDEVRPEGGVGPAGPDVVDAAGEALAVAPAAHPPQQRAGDVLERQVEVGHAGGADGVDQPVGQVGRVQVQQAHPVDPGRHLAHERARSTGGPGPGHGRRRRGPGPRARSRGRRRRRGRRPRPAPSRATGCAGGPGTTGWRRTRRPGRTPRPP